jgi:hypothetical protein
VAAELFHADGHTDRRKDGRHEANSRFSQFCGKVPKKFLRSAHGVNCVFRLCFTLTAFITKMRNVYCAVRTGSLNKTAHVRPYGTEHMSHIPTVVTLVFTVPLLSFGKVIKS